MVCFAERITVYMSRYDNLSRTELFEFARYTLDILIEHTRRYERETNWEYSDAIREEVLCSTRTDIDVMTCQYRSIIDAISMFS